MCSIIISTHCSQACEGATASCLYGFRSWISQPSLTCIANLTLKFNTIIFCNCHGCSPFTNLYFYNLLVQFAFVSPCLANSDRIDYQTLTINSFKCIHLQICQSEILNPSSSFSIADEIEYIMIDPSDSQGQMYMHYTGPPGRAGIRYMRLTMYSLFVI